MKDQATREEFIRLRAEGYSFAKISQQINVSKPTLIKWSRQYAKEIDTEYERQMKQRRKQLTSDPEDMLELEEAAAGIGVVKVIQDLESELTGVKDQLNRTREAIGHINSERQDNARELAQLRNCWPTVLGKIALGDSSLSEKTKIRKRMERLKEELEDFEIAQRWLIQRRQGTENTVRGLTRQLDIKQRALEQYNEIKQRLPETYANGQRRYIHSEKSQLAALASTLDLQDDLEKFLIKLEAA